MLYNIMVYFIQYTLTKMFRPLLLPSSWSCSYYKNTGLVNCVILTVNQICTFMYL
jgi:hypothetical protein